ncbi:hypothetical protein TOPH_04588 [Tolypocladium ophioglossoides CBS 100239]|uniref:EKC/KEOPS complex subunit BUD32 n=1 Tax=Tolypocladium ophioglossoides (strain CBS 100239) TaxID=1163406 RepID=A0A0L0N9X1_TOLOC|nr:hypothetical protein TOPH_04588 [Tolypocladium ophioglossoides CBS 100239]
MFTPFTETVPSISTIGQEYRVCWFGDWLNPPDLSTFSLAMCQLWATSEVVRHGSDSHIRELRTSPDDFLNCKVANDERQRQFLQEEFVILRRLSLVGTNIPLPQTHPCPLQDEDGSLRYLLAVRKAVHQLHQAKVIHFDLSPSNIMVNELGNLAIIDFCRGLLIGSPIPLHKQAGLKRKSEI